MKVYAASEFIHHDEQIALSKIESHLHEPEHTHDFVELVYIWRGSGCHKVNGQSYEVQRGDLIFMNVGDRHSFVADGDMQYMNILFEPDFLSEQLCAAESADSFFRIKLFQEFGSTLQTPLPKVKFRGKEMRELEELLDTMLREYLEKEDGYKAMLRGYSLLLITRAFRMMQANLKTPEFSGAGDLLPQLLSYIEQHYAGKITLQDLARESFYSPYYLSKIFKECFGFTFTEYVQEVRLRVAKRLLTETDEPIETIGRRVGYNDKAQFFRVFKQNLGVTPQQYRKQQI